MPLKRFTIGHFGELTFDQWNQLIDQHNEIEQLFPAIQRVIRTTPRRVPFIVPALITNYMPLTVNGTPQPNRWLYAWEQARWSLTTQKWVPETINLDGGTPSKPPVDDPSVTPPTGGGGGTLVRSSTVNGDPFGCAAVNMFEGGNTDIFAGQIDIAQTSYTNCDLKLFPIARGTPVSIHATSDMPHIGSDGLPASRVWFSAPNGHDKEDAQHP